MKHHSDHHATPPAKAPQRRDPMQGEPGYEDLPSLTNRVGPQSGDDAGFGTPEQGGYGNASTERARHDANDEPASRYTPAAGAKQKANASTGHGRADTSIVDDVTHQLAQDEQLEAGEILIMVASGVVTLTGNVPEQAMKPRAEELVKRVDGVSTVHNRIRVDDGSASFGPPGQAVRSGHDQQGSGFSSSDHVGDDSSDNSRGSR